MSDPPKPNIRGFVDEDDLVQMVYGKKKAIDVSTTEADYRPNVPHPDVQVWKKLKKDMKTADARTLSVFKTYSENKSWSKMCEEDESAPHIKFVGKVRASLLPF